MPISVLAALVSLLVAGSAFAGTLPPGFQESIALSGLNNPTVVRFASDGRVFVAEKGGLVKVFDGLGDPTPPSSRDLRTNVHDFWDRGLLGLALHPSFPTTPWVYVLLHHGRADRGHAAGVERRLPSPPGAAEDGCIYAVAVHRISYARETSTPAAVVAATPSDGAVPLDVPFDGSASTIPPAAR